ncbi:TPA: hypothetical protein ACOJPN_005095 [Vibrio harveyi]|uniref:hypothetical protein n=1 Tax=Vibrio harveyi TaxID=669 RepID=UPI00390AC9B4
MAVTISDNEWLYDWWYSEYLEEFETYNEYTEGEWAQNIKVFDIRLSLALSSKISFDSNFRYTKTEKSRDVSRLTLMLSNQWFCFEALLDVCKEHGYLANSRSKTTSISLETLELLSQEFEFERAIDSFWNINRDLIRSNSKFRPDLQKFVAYLSEKASKGQKKSLLHVHNKFTNNDDFEVHDVLALAYATRNQYVHAGDTPKSGVNFYTTKIAVLKNTHDFLVLLNVALSSLVLKQINASTD